MPYRDEDLVRQQVDYYSARAGEYDQWWLRQGRYQRSPEDDAAWFRETDGLQRKVRSIAQRDSVLELACGTGNWTTILVEVADELAVVDASDAMIEICRAKLGDRTDIVRFIRGDALSVDLPERVDLIFAGFLFSHIPHGLRPGLLERCRAALVPGGELVLVDSRRDPKSGSGDTESPARDVQRRILNDGRRFDIVKIYDEPRELRALFAQVGFEVVEIDVSRFFWFARIRRAGGVNARRP